jgi:hypothetical protein
MMAKGKQQEHKHLVILELPCPAAGVLCALQEYHAQAGTGLSAEDIALDALVRGLTVLVMESGSGPRQALEPLDVEDVNVQ